MNRSVRNKRVQFIDDKGSFRLEGAEDTSYLYFPIAGEKGLKGCVTPNLGGDLMTDQEHFLLEPVSVENLHNNKNTRNFWVSLEDGAVWSAVGSSAEQEYKKFTNEQDESAVSAGFMWHTMHRTSKSLEIAADITSFVPVNDNVEIMSVKIRNMSAKTIRFIPTAAIPIFGRSADNLRDHRNVTSMLHRISTVDEGVKVKPTMSFDEKGHRINETIYYVIGFGAKGELPESFFPTTIDFIREGGSFSKPRSVYRREKGKPSGYEVAGREAVGGLRFAETELMSGESIEFNIIMGIAGNEAEFEDISGRYRDGDYVAARLEETKRYWLDKVNVHFHTASSAFDRYMEWVAFQPFLRRVFGCSFLPYHDYGRGGRGWRDLWQDCLSLLFMEPDDVRKMIAANFGGVRIDGTNATIIGEGLGNFIADRNGIARVWMDHAFWPLKTLKLYIDQTGDFGILSENAPYFKDRIVMRGEALSEDGCNDESKQLSKNGGVYFGNVIEHLLVQNLTAVFEVGSHNMLRLRGADWNDALDMAADKGESVAFTHAYAGNLRDLADLLERFGEKSGVSETEVAKELQILLDTDLGTFETIDGKQKTLRKYGEACKSYVSGEKITVSLKTVADKLRKLSEQMSRKLVEQEWIEGASGEGWFNSYYDNSERAVECYSENDADVRMMLTGQVFAIMSGVAPEDKIPAITAAADRYLYRKEIGGYRLNTDFHEVKKDLGRMFGFAYGEKENGAVFSHMAVMYANALYSRGFVKEGYKALNTLAEASLDFEVSHMYPGIPEYFNIDGRGVYPYLTGAASWYLLTMITEVFGIKGKEGNLVINPKLVTEQFNHMHLADICFNFRGRKFRAVISNFKNLDYSEYKIVAATLNNEKIEIGEDGAVISLETIDRLSDSDKEENIIEVTLS